MKDYENPKYKSNFEMTFIESVLYYLSDGNPAALEGLRKTKEKDVLNYYYLNRVKALNDLLDHIAYVEYMRKKE